MSATPRLSSPFGEFALQRLPRDASHTLRAWDAADEYLLDYLAEQPPAGAPLIFNDSFGALGVSLHGLNPVLVSDSFLSRQALQRNLELNALTTEPAQRDSLSPLPAAPQTVLKLPKSSRYFEYQLQMLNHYLPPGTPVIIGAMQKYLSTVFFKLAEQHLAQFRTTLARKKARLLLGVTRGHGPRPAQAQPRYQAEYDLTLFDTPNVFSAGKLDQGSRFFLAHFPNLENAQAVIDLGCGNGILGLRALQQQPGLQVSFVDESCHALEAVRCALHAWPAQLPAAQPRSRLLWNHSLQGIAAASTDAVLCNPPFHQQQSIGTAIARQMFRDSARVLKPGGCLYVIGNRHLQYHQLLKKYFARVTQRASDRKFVMWAAHAQ